MSMEVSSQANSLDCFACVSAAGSCSTFIDEEDKENKVEVNVDVDVDGVDKCRPKPLWPHLEITLQ